MKNYLRIGCLVTLLTFATGCDAVTKGFRIGLAVSKPLVASQVTAGLLSQAAADLVNADLDDGVNAILKTEGCIKTAGSRSAKGRCYYQGAQDLRVILDRHHFQGNATLERIFTIASGAVLAFEEYDKAVNVAAASAVDGEDVDKRLERTMEDLSRQMKELQRGQ